MFPCLSFSGCLKMDLPTINVPLLGVEVVLVKAAHFAGKLGLHSLNDGLTRIAVVGKMFVGRLGYFVHAWVAMMLRIKLLHRDNEVLHGVFVAFVVFLSA